MAIWDLGSDQVSSVSPRIFTRSWSEWPAEPSSSGGFLGAGFTRLGQVASGKLTYWV